MEIGWHFSRHNTDALGGYDGRAKLVDLEDALAYVERRILALKNNHQGRRSEIWLGRWAARINDAISVASRSEKG